MNCPDHSRNEATGYCSVCGEFGCPECLFEHQGSLLCRKHYRPIAQKIEEERKHDLQRKKAGRQRLVVRYKENRRQRGVCFALNPQDAGFHLDLVDDKGMPAGQTKFIEFQDLKAVFYVKSFDGKFDKSVVYREWSPEGTELVVEFNDGEVVRGFSLRRYRGDEPRFYLIPKDSSSNNISILVEASAVNQVCSPEEYEQIKTRERDQKKEQEIAEDLSQEETMGDFYFETRNYAAALAQYELAAKKYPSLRRIRKKILVTQYDIGVQHIKRRHYADALACMEGILKADPRNPHAAKKAKQLRRVLEKTGSTGGSSASVEEKAFPEM